jgi:hypothetical protein
MDSVGSFAMAKALAKHGVMTAVHKHYSVEDWAEFVKSSDNNTLNKVMVSKWHCFCVNCSGVESVTFHPLAPSSGLTSD